MPLHERRIIGPPGCGKTTEVARQVRQIVESRGPESVLVMSFTRAAARAAAGKDLPITDDRVGTIHAMCYRALDRPTLATTKLDEWNALYPQWAVTAKQDLSEPGGGGFGGARQGDATYMAYQRIRSQMRSKDVWPGQVLAFASLYEDWKEKTCVVDFTDLLEIALEELPTPPLGASVLLLDEAQDCTPCQWTLLRQWAQSCEYFYSVGDADQLLYSWLGASVESMLMPVSQEKTLSQSYRVPRAVVEKADDWIKQASRRAPTIYKPRDADGRLSKHYATWKHPEELVENLAKLPDTETAMVLAATGYMLKPLLAVLRNRGIPFANRYASRRGDWNPLGVRHGTTMIDRMLALLRPNWPQNARMWTYEDVYLFASVMSSKDYLKRGAKKKLADMPAAERLEQEADISWLLENIFQEQVMTELFELNLEFWAESLTKAKAGPIQYPMKIYQNFGIEALRLPPRLTVGTIHSVKGGESDHVYLFPDLSRAGFRQWSQHGEPKDAVIRQFYVGMTRARESLTIMQAQTSCSVPI